MRKIWHETAWEEYLAWQGQDAKTLKRINLRLPFAEAAPRERAWHSLRQLGGRGGV